MNPEDQLDPGLNPAASYPEQESDGIVGPGSPNIHQTMRPKRLLQFDGKKWKVVGGYLDKNPGVVVIAIMVLWLLLIVFLS